MESILLTRSQRSIMPFVKRCLPQHRGELLRLLDAVAADSHADVCGRALCAIGDVLAAMPGSAAYSRSGPSHNPAWRQAIALFNSASAGSTMSSASSLSAKPERASRAAAVAELARLRSTWLVASASASSAAGGSGSGSGSGSAAGGTVSAAAAAAAAQPDNPSQDLAMRAARHYVSAIIISFVHSAGRSLAHNL